MKTLAAFPRSTLVLALAPCLCLPYQSASAGDALLVNSGEVRRVGDITYGTTGDFNRGVRVRDPSSLLVSTGTVSVFTSGYGSHAIFASDSGRIDLERVALVTEGIQAHGIAVTMGAQALINGGSILTTGNEAHGLHVRDGGKLTARNLEIATKGEKAHGVSVAFGGEINLHGTNVSTHGEGSHAVSMNGGTLNVTGGQLHSGSAAAMKFYGEGNHVTLDSTQVISDSGAVFALHPRASADVLVTNSLLSAANGQGDLFELGEGSRLDLIIDGSQINGNINIDESTDVNLVLRNGTKLNGQMTGVGLVELDASAKWHVAGNSQVDELRMAGGKVSFTDAGRYQQLSLGELHGEGEFALRLDVNQRASDFLDITGRADGRYRVSLQSSGAEPVAGFDPLEVIRTGGGDAEFLLTSGRVDLGAFSYGLARDGDSWYVSGEREGVSPSTRTVQALFNTAPSIWYGELSTLRSRLGEVRGTGDGGAWMRSYGNQYKVDTAGGLGYRQQQVGFSLGVDKAISTPESQWLVGVLGGYSRSDLSLGLGSSGEVDSYYVGAYGTWLANNGWYADALLKLNQFQNSAEVSMSDTTRAMGEYVSHGLGGSLELGKRVRLGEALFVEPFTQMSGLVVGGRALKLDNGIRAQNGKTESLLGKLGATLGHIQPVAMGGVVQPYVKAAVAHEFARGNPVKVNGHRFNNDLSGTRGEVGAGIALAMANLQLHGHVDYMGGEQIEQPWGVNLGLRYAFD